MLTIINDSVGIHDMTIPSCRLETYKYFYNEENYHSNCFDNINASLQPYGVPHLNSIQPMNVFMNTKITPDKKIVIAPPVSKAGSSITFKAETDLIVAVSACSITEGECNAGRCKPILVKFLDK